MDWRRGLLLAFVCLWGITIGTAVPDATARDVDVPQVGAPALALPGPLAAATASRKDLGPLVALLREAMGERP